MCVQVLFKLFPLCSPVFSCHLFTPSTDETSSWSLLHRQEFVPSKATSRKPTETRPERSSDASGAVQTAWRRRRCPGGRGARRRGARRGGSEGVRPLHALDDERAAGAGSRGSGAGAEVPDASGLINMLRLLNHALIFPN